MIITLGFFLAGSLVGYFVLGEFFLGYVCGLGTQHIHKGATLRATLRERRER